MLIVFEILEIILVVSMGFFCLYEEQLRKRFAEIFSSKILNGETVCFEKEILNSLVLFEFSTTETEKRKQMITERENGSWNFFECCLGNHKINGRLHTQRN